MEQLTKLLSFAAFSAIATFFVFSGTSHAASIDVSTNDMTSSVDGDCTLREAIENINNQAQTNTDCVAGDGNNDTITIPGGIITLSANLPTVTRSVTLQGAGMGATTLNGADSAYDHLNFQGSGTETFQLHRLTLKNLHYSGVQVADANFIADQVEVYGSADVDGANTDMAEGVVFQNNNSSQQLNVSLTNIHVHHLYSGAQSAMNGILVSGSGVSGITNATMRNITVDNLSSSTMTIVNGVVLSMFDGVTHTMDGSISNVTVTNLQNTQSVTGVALVGLGSATGTLDVDNVTINQVYGSVGPYGGSGGLVVTGGTSAASLTINARNVLISDVLTDDTPSGCMKADLTGLLGGSGTPSLLINSLGGNISDDDTCKTYFMQPTDQNNLAGLAASLSELADNGGYVPTVALKEGSAAIDAGVAVSGLTIDAREAARPQGTAFDVGAYESPYAKPTTSTTSHLAESGQNTLAAIVVVALLTGLTLFTQRRLVYKAR